VKADTTSLSTLPSELDSADAGALRRRHVYPTAKQNAAAWAAHTKWPNLTSAVLVPAIVVPLIEPGRALVVRSIGVSHPPHSIGGSSAMPFWMAELRVL
jgi:hypothetical protein